MKKHWTLAPVLALTLALNPFSLAGGEQGGALATPAAMAAESQEKTIKILTIEEALKLTEENNTELLKAKFDRDKKRAAAEQAIHQRRDVPDFLDRSRVKQETRVNENRKNAEFAVADRTYEVTKTTIEVKVKKYYFDVVKAEDKIEVCRAALERAQEQLRQAEIAFKVGTVAKNDVLGAQAALSSAQAELTAAENAHKLAEISLSSLIGLPTDTQYNLTSGVQYQPMEEVDLKKVIEEAQKTRLDVMAMEAAKEVAGMYYDLVVGYSAANTYDAKQARAEMEKAKLDLEDAKKNVVHNITMAYLNVLASEKLYSAYTVAAENSQESLRLTQLRYQVGMATSLDVMNASEQLSRMELNRVEALYNHHLAKLGFESEKLAHIPAGY